MDATRIGRVGISSPRLAGWSGGLSTSRRPQHPPPPPPCSRPPPLLCSLLTVAATVPERPRPDPEDLGRQQERRCNRWRSRTTILSSSSSSSSSLLSPTPTSGFHQRHLHPMTTISSIFNLLPPISQNRAGLMWKNCHNPTTKVNNLSLWYDSLQWPVNGLYLFACFICLCVGPWAQAGSQRSGSMDGSAPHTPHTLSGTPTPLLT